MTKQQKKEIKNIFQQNAQRLTKSREQMLKIFYREPECHFSVESLIKKLKKVEENNVATVYNNLAVLVNLGIIREFSANNKKYYELAQKLHGHFTCEKCGLIINLDTPGLSCLAMEINKKYDVLVTTNTIEFIGKCQKCIKRFEND